MLHGLLVDHFPFGLSDRAEPPSEQPHNRQERNDQEQRHHNIVGQFFRHGITSLDLSIPIIPQPRHRRKKKPVFTSEKFGDKIW